MRTTVNLEKLKSMVTENRLPANEKLELQTDFKEFHAGQLNDIAILLKSGKLPAGISIMLSNRSLSTSCIYELAEALKSGNCPQNLELYICDNDIDKDGAKYIADALKSGKCPTGLQILMCGNEEVGYEGAKEIADALKSGFCPQYLVINMMYNQIGNLGVTCFADALASGNCPDNLELNLDHNRIDAAGMNKFADALISGNCPKNLYLSLYMNDLEDEGAREFIKVLKSENCPSGLKISLRYNNISKPLLEEIVKTLMENIALIGIDLHHNGWTLTDTQMKIIHHCCLRNQLLLKYPEHESLIKYFSRKRGMYTMPGPLSLKHQSGLFVNANASGLKFPESFPGDLIEFLQDLQGIEKQFANLDAATVYENYVKF